MRLTKNFLIIITLLVTEKFLNDYLIVYNNTVKEMVNILILKKNISLYLKKDTFNQWKII